jgi:hypothetical protein
MHVHVLGAGTALWETPIRSEEDRWRANFEAHLVFRFTIDGGRVVHVKTRYGGIDDINGAGEAYAGLASMESSDEDGDCLYGSSSFSQDDPYHDHFVFHHGTGKWEGVSGMCRIRAWTQPTDRNEKLPAAHPIRYWGFLEGEGDLVLPNFQP